MRLTGAISQLAAVVFSSVVVFAAHASAGAPAPDGLKALSAQASSPDPAIAHEAIARLRSAGPRGLEALLRADAPAIARHAAPAFGPVPADGAEWSRVSAAIDAVAAQKDAYASGLYWYTNLADAEKAARESGRPILSLRLLGTLDTEYSCANSRFFRTVLYANKDVSRALGERFVLHWQSVRPVPRITIDFGDGRVVERTITGNSIHYILSADGAVIDALPGLYGPRAFLDRLAAAETIARTLDSTPAPRRAEALKQWHRDQADQDVREFAEDLRRTGSEAASVPGAPAAAGLDFVQAPPPTAVAAAPRAQAKFIVERPLVVALALRPATATELLDRGVDDPAWSKIAALHADDARLDQGSRALMAAKDPDALKAGRAAFSKSAVETPMARLVVNFQRSIAEDSVRDEYLFHRQIHLWLAAGTTPNGKPVGQLNQLNEQVYAQLFLTPSTDPWLGLVPADTYTALPNEGICTSKR